MKTHRHLWEQFIAPENFELAARRAVRGKKSKEQIRRFMANRDVLLARLRDMIINNKFKTSKYRIIKIHEPKERYIYVLPLYPDHIVHHALINILGPIWQRMFVNDSFACIPNRGLFSAFIYTLCYPKYIGASILKVVIKTTPRNRDVVIYSGAPRRIPSHGTYGAGCGAFVTIWPRLACQIYSLSNPFVRVQILGLAHNKNNATQP